jgi:hypothetical protein
MRTQNLSDGVPRHTRNLQISVFDPAPLTQAGQAKSKMARIHTDEPTAPQLGVGH